MIQDRTEQSFCRTHHVKAINRDPDEGDDFAGSVVPEGGQPLAWAAVSLSSQLLKLLH